MIDNVAPLVAGEGGAVWNTSALRYSSAMSAFDGTPAANVGMTASLLQIGEELQAFIRAISQGGENQRTLELMIALLILLTLLETANRSGSGSSAAGALSDLSQAGSRWTLGTTVVTFQEWSLTGPHDSGTYTSGQQQGCHFDLSG